MRNIPIVTRWLLGINVAMFLLTLVAKGIGVDINDWFGLHFFLAPDFSILQLVSYMFMHGGWEHIFFNMFALWMFGCLIENTWGPKRYLIYYLLCGVGAGLFQEIAQFVNFYLVCQEQFPGLSLTEITMVAHNSASVLNTWTTVGASGAIYGVLLAFGMLYPEERMFIFPLPVPIKAKWFVVGYFVIEVGLALTQPGDQVAHLAHVGGMVVGYFLIRRWRTHPNSFVELGNDMSSLWRRMKQKKAQQSKKTNYNKRETDYDYNVRKQASQAEIDLILDKIRRSGYESLTREEKQKLFDMSRKN